ncbi:hypothetical protein CEP52_014538 [Fusarium oligoseptatum]|uniref:Uncharacterized protein n=1 Tax=Fusarium oligoseptatum TaxID=2604345 RepID=A0A428SL76_9HYPO|nr:hypothetical protein CEP52_014538 [Fusarium oligoseptatum]
MVDYPGNVLRQLAFPDNQPAILSYLRQTDSPVTVIHISPPSVSPTPSTPTYVMFSTFFSHTEAQLPKGQLEMEIGDFDHTPAPSERSSLELSRDGMDLPRHYVDNPKHFDEPRQTQGAGVRHHLLKTSASVPMVVEKDCPAPPVLSPVSEPEEMAFKPSNLTAKHEDQDSCSAEEFTSVPGTPSPFMLPHGGQSLLSIPAADQICLGLLAQPQSPDTSMHSQECDDAASSNGTEEASQDEIPIWPSSDNGSFDSSNIHLGGD